MAIIDDISQLIAITAAQAAAQLSSRPQEV